MAFVFLIIDRMSFVILVSGLVGLFWCLCRRIQDWWYYRRFGCDKGAIAVIVIGDIGRSPRMMNHVEAIHSALLGQKLKCFDQIKLFGFRESDIRTEILQDNVTVQPLRVVAPRIPVIGPIMKLAFNCAQLWLSLSSIPLLKAIIIQNPPSVGVAIMLRILCFLRGATLILDCHNYGWTILSLKTVMICAVLPKFLRVPKF